VVSADGRRVGQARGSLGFRRWQGQIQGKERDEDIVE
jgi:hypothetical protein